MFDYSSKAIWQKTLEAGLREFAHELSGSAFANGIYYFVKVSSAAKVLTERLIIVK